jgi:hypothetical protein
VENPVTSTALVPVTAVTVWQNVNAQWERLNQNFDRSSDSLKNLQKILERIYEEKNKSFMEGFMRSQEMAGRLSGNRGSADNSDADDMPKTKKGLLGNIQKIMKALDVSGFELITYIGEKAVGYILDKRKEAKQEAEAGDNSSEESGAEDSKKEKSSKEKKPGFMSKLSDSLGAIDISGLFDKVRSLGETAVKANATDEDKAKWENIQKGMTNAVGSMGQKAIEALRPALDMLSTAFQSEQMVAAVNFMANIFMVIATVISMVVEGLMYMATVVQQNWDVIGPILGAIAFVLLAAMIAQVYSLAVAWLVANWPILLVVAAVALLLYCLQQAGVSVDEVVAVVAAAFGWLNVFIQNIIIYLYNAFVSFADFFRNLFLDPTYAVKKLFYDLATGVLDLFYQMAVGTENFAGGFIKVIADAINAALRKLKNLTDFLSKIPGFEFLANFEPNFLDAENPHVFSDMILKQRGKLVEPTSDKPVFDTKKKEYISPEAVMVDYARRAKNVTDNFDNKIDIKDYTQPDAASGFKSPAGNVAPNINKVGEVGKINDTVDISSDDLKLMRELAEIQAIQNFVELTPTVQVTTGNINNAGDIDTIINKIGQKLNEEFISTAQGVYT